MTRGRFAIWAGVLTGVLAVANQGFPRLDWLRVDPSLLLVFACGLLAFATWIRDRGYVGWPQWKLALLFAMFLPGMFLADGPYAELKVWGILFGFATALVVMQLLRLEPARLAFLVTMAVAGVGLAAALRVFGTTDPLSGRATVWDLSPIGVGFMCCLAAMLLFLAALRQTRSMRAGALLAVSAGCGYQAATTGSRGVLIAAVLAVAVAFLFSATRGRFAGIVAVAAIVVSSVLLLRSSTADFASRLTTADSSNRVDLWRSCLDAIGASFWGAGWGDMVEHVRVPSQFVVVAGDRQYAHNLLLEAAVEGGWAGALGLLAMLVTTWRWVKRAATDPVGQALLAVWVFAVANACVSGDLAGNRLLWAAFGGALALELQRRRDPDPLVQFQPPDEPGLRLARSAVSA